MKEDAFLTSKDGKCPKCGAKIKLVYVPPDIYTPDGRVEKCSKCKWNDYW